MRCLQHICQDVNDVRRQLARHCIVRRPANSTLNANGGLDKIESKLSDDLQLSTVRLSILNKLAALTQALITSAHPRLS